MRTVWPDLDGGRLRAAYPSALRPTYYTVTEDDLLLSLAATFVTSTKLGDTKLAAACASATCSPSRATVGGDWAAGWQKPPRTTSDAATSMSARSSAIPSWSPSTGPAAGSQCQRRPRSPVTEPCSEASA